MLTLSEQQQLLSGHWEPEGLTLEELVTVSSTNFAIQFRDNYKVFPLEQETDVAGEMEPINSEAAVYRGKMLRLTKNLVDYKKRRDIVLGLIDVLGSIAAGIETVTPEALDAATNEIWEGFINNNILKAMETVAEVLREERDAYNAIEEAPAE